VWLWRGHICVACIVGSLARGCPPLVSAFSSRRCGGTALSRGLASAAVLRLPRFGGGGSACLRDGVRPVAAAPRRRFVSPHRVEGESGGACVCGGARLLPLCTFCVWRGVRWCGGGSVGIEESAAWGVLLLVWEGQFACVVVVALTCAHCKRSRVCMCAWGTIM